MHVLYSYVKKNNLQTPDRDTQGKLFNNCRSGVLAQKWIRNVCKLTLKSSQGMLLKVHNIICCRLIT